MAVFPDKIVLKSSADPESQIFTQIASGGSDPIVPGEIVISRQDGSANILTVDANGDVVSASVPDLASLSDVDLDDYSTIPNSSIITFDAATQTWNNSPAPPHDISGNDLGDIGDVVIASIAGGDIIRWNVDNNQWENVQIEPQNLSGVSEIPAGTAIAGGSVLRYNSDADPNGPGNIGWEVTNPVYGDITDRPTALSDLTKDLEVEDLSDVVLDDLEIDDILSWNGSNWVNVEAPPVDLSNGYLADIGDVTEVNVITGAVPVYNAVNSEYEIKKLDYDEIANRPVDLSDLVNDLSVSDFPNDAGYLTATEGLSITSLEDANINNAQEGQILIYRSGLWENEFGPPANISFNSIGDLIDVDYFQPGVNPGVLTIENLGTINLDSPAIGNGFSFRYTYNTTYGVGMEALRDSDNSGSAVYADRSRGVTLRSDVNIVRLSGRPTTTTNRPELRWEEGDSGAATSTGEYVGIKLPETLDESTVYLLPERDGDPGDILATDGSGKTTWISSSTSGSLGELDDVDLNTIPPTGGQALVYNALAGVWLPGDVSNIDLSTSSIDELADVDTTTTAPVEGQALVWDSTVSNWLPGDVSSASTLDDILGNGNTTSKGFAVGVVSVGAPDYYSGNKVIQVGSTIASPNSYTMGFGGAGVVGWVQTVGNAGDMLFANNQIGSSVNINSQGDINLNLSSGTGLTVDANGTSLYTAGTLRFQTTNTGATVTGQLLSTVSTTSSDSGLTLATKDYVDSNSGGSGGGGGGGGAYTDKVTQAVLASSGQIQYDQLGRSGILVDITSDADAWVTFYASSAALTADASRAFNTDPATSSGVLAEFYISATQTIKATPGTVYFNDEPSGGSQDVIFAAVRDQSGNAVNATVTTTAYAGVDSTGGSASNLGDLNDVELDTPLTEGQALVVKDGQWVNGPVLTQWETAGADPYASDVVLLMNFNDNLDDETQISTPETAVGTTQYLSGLNDTNAVSFVGTNSVRVPIVDPNDDSLDLSGDFCIEFWARPSSVSGLTGLIVKRNSGGVANSTWGIKQNNGTWGFNDLHSLPVAEYVSSESLVVDVWQHLAVSREGSTLRLFYNGALTDTFSGVNRDYSNPYAVEIGSWGGSFTQYFFQGRMEDLRITKGSARYTASFTPPSGQIGLDVDDSGEELPTVPLDLITNVDASTPVSGAPLVWAPHESKWVPGVPTTVWVGNTPEQYAAQTSCLMNFNGNLDEEVGLTVLPLTYSWTYGQGRNSTPALEFDGTKRFEINADSSLDLDGDFTIEFWWRPNNITSFQGLLNRKPTSGANTGAWQIYQNTSGQIEFVDLQLGDYRQSGSVIAANQWHHIAIIRQNCCSFPSSTITMFVNGQAQATWGNSTNFTNSHQLNVGQLNSGTLQAANGMMEDLRITKGIARYTGNFVPPQSELSLLAPGSAVSAERASITTADLKTLVASSADFADFQSRIAAL